MTEKELKIMHAKVHIEHLIKKDEMVNFRLINKWKRILRNLEK